MTGENYNAGALSLEPGEKKIGEVPLRAEWRRETDDELNGVRETHPI